MGSMFVYAQVRLGICKSQSPIHRIYGRNRSLQSCDSNMQESLFNKVIENLSSIQKSQPTLQEIHVIEFKNK